MSSISEILTKARAAGMSYGEYVSRHPDPPKPQKIEKSLDEQVLELHAKGKSLNDITKAIGSNFYAVRDVYDRHGLIANTAKNRNNKIFEEHKEEIRRRIENGESVNKISASLGISSQALRVRLKANDMPLRVRDFHFTLTKEELKNLIDNHSYAEIVEITGYTIHTINKWVTKYGLSRRKREENNV